MNLKTLLRNLRIAHELTQPEAAQKFGVSPATVRAWESGESQPKLGVVRNIAEGYGVSADEILRIAEADTTTRRANSVFQLGQMA